ncbi:FtsJ-like methyltransferase-domain-containing protein [Lipomyces kononenkoae]|uniref:FtsJ-like methyltransferase-domain-containing protein n=1 Tax=Lipomyces kononenkoae TaxID=34357 RepID=A0ACC3SU81_LIPKO
MERFRGFRVFCKSLTPLAIRRASSGGSERWTLRQRRDPYSREATRQNLKSRAAFKLLEIDDKYHIFQQGQTVVDLGYAPGSWTQIAVDRTGRNGHILGIDILPCAPPPGVSAIQGNFLHIKTQRAIKAFLLEQSLGRQNDHVAVPVSRNNGSYGVFARQRQQLACDQNFGDDAGQPANYEKGQNNGVLVVDVVLSDMMANTSGNSFRDHAMSMDLCHSAIAFALDTLKTGGHFVCKFYSGPEDVDLELRLREAFEVVKREKPRASRSESREQYFVSKSRKRGVTKQDLYGYDYDN